MGDAEGVVPPVGVVIAVVLGESGEFDPPHAVNAAQTTIAAPRATYFPNRFMTRPFGLRALKESARDFWAKLSVNWRLMGILQTEYYLPKSRRLGIGYGIARARHEADCTGGILATPPVVTGFVEVTLDAIAVPCSS
ncbi:hypothetical protein [Pararobbsia silviterrae]|uniref:hypothetical protein n=1 Tax=Pararobbsia silviterrae TaxID=1792498 RepID=UPI0011C41DA4|nr:hypothetical protein [Pararobbsia silviterrae]